MNFKKSDLRDGDIVEYRTGNMRIVKGDNLHESLVRKNNLSRYNENLENLNYKDLDIVRVYRSIWERKELTITSDEKVILRNIDSKGKYIARDKNEDLYAYTEEPTKHERRWVSSETAKALYLFNHLFKMVKWEDEEPWRIKALLKLPEKDKEA